MKAKVLLAAVGWVSVAAAGMPLCSDGDPAVRPASGSSRSVCDSSSMRRSTPVAGGGKPSGQPLPEPALAGIGQRCVENRPASPPIKARPARGILASWRGGIGDAAAADDPLRPAAIAVEGIPPIPPELWSTLKRYQEVRTAQFVDWDPMGKGILMASRIENLHQLYRVAEPGAPPRKITAGDEPVSDGRFLPDGSLLFTRAKGGDENNQILLAGRDGSGDTLLTDGKSRHILFKPHPAGKIIPFSSTRRNGQDADLFSMEIGKGGEPELLHEVHGETWSLSDWSPDGRRAILSRFISANESFGRLFDWDTRRSSDLPSEVAGETGPQRAQGVSRADFHFGPEGKSILFLSDAAGEFRQLARLDLATGKTGWLTPDLPWDVENVELSPDRRQAFISVNANGFARLFRFEDLAAAQPARREYPLPMPGTAGDLRFSPDGRHIGMTLGGPQHPGEAYSLELESGKWTAWTRSEKAGFESADFVAPVPMHFYSFDGLKSPAFLYLPPGGAASPGAAGAGKIPVIISIHGGPESQSRPGFSALTQFYIRSLGAALILPNVRGSTGYGKSYSLLDNGRKREDSVRDIGALLDWIRIHGSRKHGLDPDRVAVVGGSYGGYMVLASLLRFGAQLRCGVDSVGITDFNSFLKNTSGYRRNLRRAEYGDERDPEISRFFESISPLRLMDGLQSALFLIHGKNDPRVPFSETLQVVKKARDTRQPVWTAYAGNEGHGFTRRDNRDYQEAATTLFLKQHLLPERQAASPGALGEPRARDEFLALRPMRFRRAQLFEQEGQLEEALRDYQALIEVDPAPALRHLRANVLFKLTKFKESIQDYNTAATAGEPHSEDSCWERGLAWYYVGDFEAGRKQFEGYHRVDSLDIENGIWRYLCIAEKEGLEKAVATLLPYDKKVRQPFPALFQLYAGKGSAAEVLEQARAGNPPPDRLNENLFYAHYYIGKYEEARRDRAAALRHIEEALRHEIGHFMYSCARIDLARVRDGLKKPSELRQ